MRGAGRAKKLRLVLAVACATTCALAVPSAASAAMTANGSVEQVYVTGATPGQTLTLLNKKSKRVGKPVPVGSLGGALFRRVPSGKGYRVRAADGSVAGPIVVLPNKNAPKDTSIYNQALPAGGYGYMNTRDGTSLSMTVHLPGPVQDGPYPTLIEYSGYGYADPAGPESGISQVANLLGWAVVDVNMRGTGCSGGAFDFFERLQGLDGYDLVETVANQPWVKGGKVGMMGISYGGISQLFVAAAQPPSLAAITPLSVIEGTATTLYPGGILNTGFAFEWAKDRVEDAKPATANPAEGQRWAYNRIQNGDQTCKANQVMHTAATDLLQKVRNNRFYRPKIANPLTPAKFVHKIKVPVFMSCQFNDEQTGAFCPNLTDRFTGTKKKWFTYTNGLHIDSLMPATFQRWHDFISLYVADEKPVNDPGINALAPLLFEQFTGVPGVQLPPDPIKDQPTFDAAKAAFEALPQIRILFDTGGLASDPGKSIPGFEASFNKWPIPSAKPMSLYLGDNGTLIRKPSKTRGSDTFLWDKEARPADNFPGTNTGGGDLWTDTPSSDWRQPPDGTAASYISGPLAQDTALIGGGALRAWINASVPDVDLQVVITEVRPDGKETYVQSGYMRASMRKLDKEESSLLEPIATMLKQDAAPLPRRLSQITIPLYYQGHMYRAGSRIRVSVTAPSGDQPVWSFAETVPLGDARVTVAFSKKKPSRLILPRVPGITAPTPLPPCPGLRGEPCRTYTGP